MIATLFWSALGAFAILALVSLAWLAGEEGSLKATDILVVIAPFIVWLLLLFFWQRPKSLSNLVEPFALVPIIATALAVRAFGFSKRSHTARSVVAFTVCVIAAVGLYALVPALPE